ncbi:MAG TPA: MASE1 domain-containing protein [Candidatus Binataceae bacterium]|nr:MASE1 domain-containing protein [Candidatus Binataceae bacterium]
MVTSGDAAVESARSKIETQISALAIAAGVFVAYFLTGKLGLRLATVHPSATAVWAPSGIALAACLLVGSWIWPAILLAAFLVNLTTYGSFATSMAIGVGNTLEALTAAYLIQRYARGASVFNRAGDAFRFIFFAAVLSTMLSATIGVSSLCLGGYAKWSNYGWIWFTWWMGDATGDLIITPLLLLWARGPTVPWDRSKIFEATIFSVIVVLLAGAMFGGISPTWAGHAFLIIPILLWAAFRFGPRATATVVFFLSIVAIAGTLNSIGPFIQHYRPHESVLLMQAFIALIGTSNLVAAIEVAERRRLDEARWRLAAIVESSEDAILVCSPAMQITAWNTGAERMYGFTAAEAIGKPLSMMIPPERTDEPANVVARINNGETIAPFETVRRRKDGSLVDVSISVSPARDSHGQIVAISSTARDITHLKQAREEREALLLSERAARETAETANRAKDEFLAMLGHELRNPLHSITLATQLLDRPEHLEKARGIISRQGQHVSRLVDDLLDAARVTSGRIVLNRTPINLAALVAESVASLRETGQLKNHTLDTELETVWVDGDRDRLSQVVANLLGNAIKYTPLGGKITVRVKERAEAVIEVQDDGAGIAPEILPSVFELFSRGQFGLHRSPAGLGIGLTLVKRIAELHGGRAQAASAGPGRGSTFTVALPSIAAPAADRVESGTKSDQTERPCRILLIEDSDDARESLRAWLAGSGHEVYEARDGPSGVRKALEVRPDVVVIDLGLPGLDGYQVAASIRSASSCAAATLIALTGYGQNEYRARAERAGFHGYLVKPVDTDALEKLIAARPAVNSVAI